MPKWKRMVVNGVGWARQGDTTKAVRQLGFFCSVGKTCERGQAHFTSTVQLVMLQLFLLFCCPHTHIWNIVVALLLHSSSSSFQSHLFTWWHKLIYIYTDFFLCLNEFRGYIYTVKWTLISILHCFHLDWNLSLLENSSFFQGIIPQKIRKPSTPFHFVMLRHKKWKTHRHLSILNTRRVKLLHWLYSAAVTASSLFLGTMPQALHTSIGGCSLSDRRGTWCLGMNSLAKTFFHHGLCSPWPHLCLDTSFLWALGAVPAFDSWFAFTPMWNFL